MEWKGRAGAGLSCYTIRAAAGKVDFVRPWPYKGRIMDWQTILFVLLSFFGAAFVKGMTGLGFSTLCLGVLAAFIDVKTAIPLVILPSLCSNMLVMADSGRVREAVRRFWPMFACALCGLAAGIWVLGTQPSGLARSVLGAVMMLYGAWALWNGEFSVPERLIRPLALPVGLLTGWVNGMTGSQIMPILPYLMAIGIGKNMLVATINMSFTLSSLGMLAGLGTLGLLTRDALVLAGPGLVLVLAGIRLGSILRRKASEETFRKLVLALLICLGGNLIFNG